MPHSKYHDLPRLTMIYLLKMMIFHIFHHQGVDQFHKAGVLFVFLHKRRYPKKCKSNGKIIRNHLLLSYPHSLTRPKYHLKLAIYIYINVLYQIYIYIYISLYIHVYAIKNNNKTPKKIARPEKKKIKSTFSDLDQSP